MKYAKIIVKNNYEQRGDLVLRSYIRALKRINAQNFLDGDNALIYGTIDDNGLFQEMFTREVINYDNYIMVSQEEYLNAYASKPLLDGDITNIIGKLLFNKDIDLDIDLSSNEELASDRKVEFEAYSSFLSRINPYQRLNDIKEHNDYNNFLKKIEAIRLMIINDSMPIEDDEYEVLENPKRLVRK